MIERSERLLDIYDAFMRPELPQIRIVGEGGKEEPFEPVTLIESLAESEVPLPHAFGVYDIFRQLAVHAAPEGSMTPKEVHSLVVDSIRRYRPPPDHDDLRPSDKALWLTNYESIYAPESAEVQSRPGFVAARKASELRSFVAKFLTRELGIDATDAADARRQVSNFMRQGDLRSLVNRFIKIIRYCGFHDVETGFLDAFCRNLALYSSKAILPSAIRSPAELRDRLEEAEGRLELAMISGRTYPYGVEDLLRTAAQIGASALLEGNGLLALKAPIEAVKQLRYYDNKAKAFRQSSGSLTQAERRIVDAVDGLDSNLRQFSLSFDVLADESENLASVLDAADPDKLHEATERCCRFLDLVRVALGEDEQLGEVISAMQSRARDPVRFVNAVGSVLEKRGFHVSLSPVDGARSMLLVDPGTSQGSHLFDFARNLCIISLSDPKRSEWGWVDVSGFVERVGTVSRAAGLIVSDPDLSPDVYENLDTLAQEGKVYMIRWEPHHLIRTLSAQRNLFDEVASSIRRSYANLEAVKNARLSRIRTPPIGDELGVFEKGRLLAAWGFLDEYPPRSGECAIRLLRLLDMMLWTAAAFVVGYGQARWGESWKKATAPMKYLSQPCLPIGTDQGDILRLFEEANSLARATGPFAQLRRFVPSSTQVRTLRAITRFRNDFPHPNTPEITPAMTYQFLVHMNTAAEILAPLRRGYRVVAANPQPGGKILVVHEDGESSRLEPRVVDPWRGVKYWIGFEWEDAKAAAHILPVWPTCLFCRSSTPPRFLTSSPQLQCPACEKMWDLPERFADVRKLFLARERGEQAREGGTETSALSCLETIRASAWAEIAATQEFVKMSHESLLERLQETLRRRLPTGAISAIHCLRERGVDILLTDAQGRRIGFQVKSDADMSKSGVIASVKAQIQDSRSHNLDAFFLILCCSMEARKETVNQLLSDVSTMNDEYVALQRVFPPQHAHFLLFAG